MFQCHGQRAHIKLQAIRRAAKNAKLALGFAITKQKAAEKYWLQSYKERDAAANPCHNPPLADCQQCKLRTQYERKLAAQQKAQKLAQEKEARRRLRQQHGVSIALHKAKVGKLIRTMRTLA